MCFIVSERRGRLENFRRLSSTCVSSCLGSHRKLPVLSQHRSSSFCFPPLLLLELREFQGCFGFSSPSPPSLHLYCPADSSSSSLSSFFSSLLYSVLFFNSPYFPPSSLLHLSYLLLSFSSPPSPPASHAPPCHFRTDGLSFSFFFSTCLFHFPSLSHRLLPSRPSQRTQFLVPVLLSAPFLVFLSEHLLEIRTEKLLCFVLSASFTLSSPAINTRLIKFRILTGISCEKGRGK